MIRCIEQMHGGEIFIPKIPSMSIMELVRSVAPDCKIERIGIRPGGGLRELLVSEERAHRTAELDDMFVVLPHHPWWSIDNWVSAKPVSDGYSFGSDTNNDWLSIEEMQALIYGMCHRLDGRSAERYARLIAGCARGVWSSAPFEGEAVGAGGE